MLVRLHHRLALVAAAVVLALSVAARAPLAAPASPPSKLSDQEFWRLVTDFSEPEGYFQSDNLVSNEKLFQHVIPQLQQKRGHGAYLGVAPDQNFTFIAALDPQIAFIVDIRRGNLLEHLMYKALFELSTDRADFYSRLFSRRRPDGLGAMSGVAEIVSAFSSVPASDALHRDNVKAIEDQIVRKHGFRLSDDDLREIERIYEMFGSFGPGITYQPRNANGRGQFRLLNMPSYAELQTATDAEGRNRSYLANEENFRIVKSLESRNLIVPIVGDFAGSKALRAVGRYLAEQGATVTAFYVSNVEQYLFQNDVWRNFYENLSGLPLDDGSVFIRSIGGREVMDPIRGLIRDVFEGKVQSYVDLRDRGLR